MKKREEIDEWREEEKGKLEKERIQWHRGKGTRYQKYECKDTKKYNWQKI